MLYFFLYYASRNFINTTANKIYSLILYLKQAEIYEIEVDGNNKTFFSDFSKAKGISLEIETNDNTILGPFDSTSHIFAIDFEYSKSISASSYKLKLVNEDQDDVSIAMVFGRSFSNQYFSNYNFIFSSAESDQYNFYTVDYYKYYDKKYGYKFILISLGIIGFQFLLIICCCCHR